MKDKHRGSHAEIKACAWLLEQGYDVFWNVSQHGDADIVAIKGDEIRLFDVKASYRGGCGKPGIEHMFPQDDGSFRIMGDRKHRELPTRELTPREKVLKRMSAVDP